MIYVICSKTYEGPDKLDYDLRESWRNNPDRKEHERAMACSILGYCRKPATDYLEIRERFLASKGFVEIPHKDIYL